MHIERTDEAEDNDSPGGLSFDDGSFETGHENTKQ
jgi:hypothetical protein